MMFVQMLTTVMIMEIIVNDNDDTRNININDDNYDGGNDGDDCVDNYDNDDDNNDENDKS